MRRTDGRADADPRRPELGRGGGARDRQRPAHGLHGGRARPRTWRRAWSRWPRRARSCITPSTLRLVEGYVAGASRWGRVPVKGLDEPSRSSSWSAPGTVRSRLQAAAARGLTRFVGRDSRAGAARARRWSRPAPATARSWRWSASPAWASRAWSGSSPTRTAPRAGWSLESGSVSYGKATAYLPGHRPAQALLPDRGARRRAQDPREGDRQAARRWTRRSSPSLPALLCAARRARRRRRSGSALDPPQRRQRTLDGVKRLLLRESQVQPLLLVFEDLHWIDAETQALLDSLVESLPTARLLLLVNYRPEYQHGWGSKTYYPQLRSTRCRPRAPRSCSQALLGDDPGLAAAQAAADRAHRGQSVLPGGERADPGRDRGAGRRARRLSAGAGRCRRIQVPATVQAVLAARIDRLAPEDKRLLQAAAVIGKDVPFALLQAIAELPEEALRQRPRAPAGRRVPVRDAPVPRARVHLQARPDPRGGLRQPAPGAAARACTPGSSRPSRRLYPDRLAEQVERLAHHAVRGEVWEKAVAYLPAGRAPRRSRARRTARRWRTSSRRWRPWRICPRPARRSSRPSISASTCATRSVPLGESGGSSATLREAEAWPSARRSAAARAGSCPRWAITLGARDPDGCAHFVPVRPAIADTSPRETSPSRPRQILPSGCGPPIGLGDYRQGQGPPRQGTAAPSRASGCRSASAPPGLTSVLSMMALAWCQAELGAFAEGIARGEEGVRIAEAVDHPLSLMFADLGVGQLYLVQGDLVRAIPTTRDARLATCRDVGLPVLASVGWLHEWARRTRWPVVSRTACRCWSVGGASASMGWRADASALTVRGRARPTSGPAGSGCVGTGGRALDLAVEHGAAATRPGPCACAERSPAGAIRPNSRPGRRPLPAGSRPGRGVGMRPLVAHCHLGLGRAVPARGRAAASRRARQTATTMFREMGMRYWLDRLEAELRAMPPSRSSRGLRGPWARRPRKRFPQAEPRPDRGRRQRPGGHGGPLRAPPRPLRPGARSPGPCPRGAPGRRRSWRRWRLRGRSARSVACQMSWRDLLARMDGGQSVEDTSSGAGLAGQLVALVPGNVASLLEHLAQPGSRPVEPDLGGLQADARGPRRSRGRAAPPARSGPRPFDSPPAAGPRSRARTRSSPGGRCPARWPAPCRAPPGPRAPPCGRAGTRDPRPVERDIGGDAIDPRGERGLAAEARQGLADAGERLLAQVVGLARPGQAGQIPPDPRLELVVYALKSSAAPAGCPLISRF